MSKEALRLALEALEYIYEGANNQGPHTGISWRCVSNKAESAITALREALTSVPDWASEAKEQPAPVAKPHEQEPVAKDDADIYEFWARNKETERQQKPMAYGKPWVGLDHDDIHALMNEYFYEGMQPSAIHFANFARAIEAKLKEKNT